MDNIFGVELPSDVLPTVSGKQYVICKTSGGGLNLQLPKVVGI